MAHRSRDRLLVGAVAGCVATVPQTAAMEAVRRWLPGGTRGRFPPRQVTESVVVRVTGRRPKWSEPTWWVTTAASHFAFGTAAGAAYATVPAVGPVPVRGAAFGLAVWAAHYLVLFPLVGIRTKQGDRPVRATMELIAAHVAWGAATAALFERLAAGGRPPAVTRPTSAATAAARRPSL